MNISSTIDSAAVVENAGGLNYLAFPYLNTIGKTHEMLSVRVPIHGDQASANDRQALAEAVAVQGALGEWQLHDGAVWLVARS